MHAVQMPESDAILIEQLAAEAALSRSQLQKLFREEVGEPIGRYVARIRLEAAAQRLLYSHEPLMDVAINVGYGSQQAFSRAFVRQFGVTPQALRATKGPVVDTEWGDLIRQDPDYGREVEVEIHRLPAIPVRAVRFHGPYYRVPARWVEFSTLLRRDFPPCCPRHGLGLVYDDPRLTPPERIRYDCSVRLDGGGGHVSRQQAAAGPAPAEDGAGDPAAGWFHFTTAAGRYACARAPIGLIEMGRLFAGMLAHWVPVLRRADHRRPFADALRPWPHGGGRSRGMWLCIGLE
ncbi:MAG: helix-turn-helix domain-containing protein [Arhodomonas sp.]|nr:helix-turn-helix domain-containing protein [Arhodomonas sp.]